MLKAFSVPRDLNRGCRRKPSSLARERTTIPSGTGLRGQGLEGERRGCSSSILSFSSHQRHRKRERERASTKPKDLGQRSLLRHVEQELRDGTEKLFLISHLVSTCPVVLVFLCMVHYGRSTNERSSEWALLHPLSLLDEHRDVAASLSSFS